LDRATGDVPFQHLYYLPIILAAQEFGFSGGLLVSSCAVLLYHLANPRLIGLQDFRQGDRVQIILFFTVGLIAAKLVQDANRLRLLSITDDLTGLHNLRSFESRLETLVRNARKDGSVLSILVLDVDRLKSLNDQYGHLAGADAVRTVGRVIANHTAERLRLSVSNEEPVLATHAFPAGTLSISIGTASRFIEKDDAPLDIGEQLFKAADHGLYRAKAMGRNGVSTGHYKG
jgi:GGDEF domain-containing protein